MPAPGSVSDKREQLLGREPVNPVAELAAHLGIVSLRGHGAQLLLAHAAQRLSHALARAGAAVLDGCALHRLVLQPGKHLVYDCVDAVLVQNGRELIHHEDVVLQLGYKLLRRAGHELDYEAARGLDAPVRVDQHAQADGGGVFSFGDLVIDTASHSVKVAGQEAPLTPKEFDLLVFLVSNKGIALSREKILQKVWNYDYYGEDRTVDTHIKMLRGHLGHCRSYIVTVWGIGYKFDPDVL